MIRCSASTLARMQAVALVIVATLLLGDGPPVLAAGARGAAPRAPGDQLWVARYDGPGHGGDFAYAVEASPDGSRVFVTGDSYGGSSTLDDYLTIAYDPRTGGMLWKARYDGPKHDSDFAAALQEFEKLRQLEPANAENRFWIERIKERLK